MATGTVVPGALVAWWNEGELQCAVVAGEDKRKIRLVRVDGQEARVQPSRLAFTIEAGGEAPGADPERRRAAGRRAAAMAQRVRSLAAACDVATLWELAGEAEGSPSLEGLADLAFGARGGAECVALVRALLDDNLHFVRKGEHWEPRSADALEQLRLQRRREAERAEQKDRFIVALQRAVAGEGFEPTGSAMERRYLRGLEDLAMLDVEAPDGSRTLAHEALSAAGIRYDRPHEGAFRLLRLLGRIGSDDENLDVQRYGLRGEFPAVVLDRSRAAAERGFSRHARADLTGLEVFTIDSPRTREIDDGLSVERSGGRGVRLGVHIADPAAFVQPDDAVDREALARAVTHYLPDRKLLMIPEAISEGVASLLPDEERPALSFLVELDERGRVGGYEVVRSVVRSRGRLSYAEADLTIDQPDGRPFGDALAGLDRVTAQCEARRSEAGAVRIVAGEVDVHVDAAGVVRVERHPDESAARRCITEAMVLAGSIAATFCGEHRLPAIYRRQGEPQRPLEIPEGGRWDPVSAYAARRALRRGEVGLEPGPHHALGLEAYAQVSSPLRRYQDLALHRQIISVLEGRDPTYDVAALQRIAATTEQAEIDSRRVERAANRYWLLRYLEQRRPPTVVAVVLATAPRAIVQLEETLLEQPVPSLQDVEPGQRVELAIERVNPRADLLVLRAA